MKILLSLLLTFSFALSAQIDEFASEVNYLRDYKSALKTAKEQNKPLMLVVVGDYCPWCKKFERKTLNSSLIQNQVKKDFIPIIIDKTKDKGTYPPEFYARRIPTVFFINPTTQKHVFESMGYSKKVTFAIDMDLALKAYKKEIK
ncbi:MAG: thioredoxin family protein [Sulfurimonas sp.]|jgi:thiol:disulfide interchange protein|nr:thioredoxin family protein [Sulfurimonas sp.]